MGGDRTKLSGLGQLAVLVMVVLAMAGVLQECNAALLDSACPTLTVILVVKNTVDKDVTLTAVVGGFLGNVPAMSTATFENVCWLGSITFVLVQEGAKAVRPCSKLPGQTRCRLSQAPPPPLTVTWFNSEKGFGFTSPDGGGADVFVHHSAILGEGYRSLPESLQVGFQVTM